MIILMIILSIKMVSKLNDVYRVVEKYDRNYFYKEKTHPSNGFDSISFFSFSYNSQLTSQKTRPIRRT